jgi:hypothetical protein
VKWITFTGSDLRHDVGHRVAQADFNIRAGQGRNGVILRRRPCFFANHPSFLDRPQNRHRRRVTMAPGRPETGGYSDFTVYS